MENKNFSLKKELTESGVGKAVISTLNVIDKDNDVKYVLDTVFIKVTQALGTNGVNSKNTKH